MDQDPRAFAFELDHCSGDPMKEAHIAVWMDHKEARVFHISPSAAEEKTVDAGPKRTHFKHPKGSENVKEHADDTRKFFHEVATSLSGTETVLLVGPSSAKFEFRKYIQEHDHALDPRIAGVETVDHPTDGQVVAFARTFFEKPVIKA